MKFFKRRWTVPQGVEPTEMDRKIMFYEQRGHEVPTRSLIKTPEQIEGIRQSGKINTGVLDMGAGWYDDPQILALFRRQQEIARFAYSLDRTKRNDIALVYDTESVHHVSQRTSNLVLDYYRTSDLGRIGAPVDYYFHNDLADPRMPDYRLYVMLNQYYLTDAEREAVYAKARRNGATVLWLYAAGFVNPKAEKVIFQGCPVHQYNLCPRQEHRSFL